MYAKVKKAIYEILEASLLFWEKLSSSLHNVGFFPNPYDGCVMKNITNGEKFTMTILIYHMWAWTFYQKH